MSRTDDTGDERGIGEFDVETERWIAAELAMLDADCSIAEHDRDLVVPVGVDLVAVKRSMAKRIAKKRYPAGRDDDGDV